MRYFDSVRDWHGYIRFLGLPHLRDNPDVPIENLFVEPRVSRRHIHPDTPPKRWPKTQRAIDAFAENRRLVLLGDPGSGKSTLVSWIAWQFARPERNDWTRRFGPLVPLPMVLRELRIDESITWDTLLDRFLEHAMAEPLREKRDVLADLLARGQAFIMLDGVDEITSVDVRKALRKAVLGGIGSNFLCPLLLTSRIVGYEEVPFGLAGGLHGPGAQIRRMQESVLDKAVLGQALGGTELDEESMRAALDDALTRPAGQQRLSSLLSAAALRGEAVRIADVLTRSFTTIAEALAPATIPIGEALRRVGEALLQTSVNYLVPFDDNHIERFARNWCYQHVTEKAMRDERAASLVTAIRRNEGTQRLARIPNLLTMMALIHRVRADLPYGRGNLYNDIAEAYLHSIDEFRQIREHEYTLDEKKCWLAKVGYEMQVRRGETAPAHEEDIPRRGGVLVDEARVLAWVIDAMEDMGHRRDKAEVEARQLVDYIARRSGLLIPRGEGQFAFVHLSFQEYFAAGFLLDQVMEAHWLPEYNKEDAEREPDGHELTPERLVHFAQDPIWRETFCLLFELLPKRRRWPDQLAHWLFGGDQFDRLFEEARVRSDDSRGTQLLAELAVDPYSGLSDDFREEALAACWRWELSVQQEGRGFGVKRPVAATLTGATAGMARLALRAFEVCLSQSSLRRLVLGDCAGLTDLSPVAAKSDLQELFLLGCTGLSELQPLAPLTALQELDLRGCTGLTQLGPVAGLTSLQYLHLSGCTGLSDLGPLAGLTSLQGLDLSGWTGLSDLGPLAGLTSLRRLFLSRCTRLSDLAPLAGLTSLQRLDLSGCTGLIDLSPLAGLASLQGLDLSGCTGLSDLGPVAGLTNLQDLHLNGCTGLSDLGPVAGLTSLQRLYLDGCMGLSDLGPLGSLTSLQGLNLSGCTDLSELGPLGGLTNLQHLLLSGCTGLSDLGPVAGLTNLKDLSLYGCTRVSDLGPLAGLTSLETLNLTDCTGLSDLAPLAGLTTLQSLNFYGCTGIRSLPKELRESPHLDIQGFPSSDASRG